MTKDIVSAKVIPWDRESWGVSVVMTNGRTRNYVVGAREKAEDHAAKLQPKVKIIHAA